LVLEWLHEHVDAQSIEYAPAKDFLSFTLPVVDIERLLNAQYSVYRHADGSELVRTPEWSLPLHLHEHITVVQPTTSFLRPLPQAKTSMIVPGTEGLVLEPIQLAENETPTVAKVCNHSGITPDCLRTLYGT
jgi:tripeptidyl-peptidase I